MLGFALIAGGLHNPGFADEVEYIGSGSAAQGGYASYGSYGGGAGEDQPSNFYRLIEGTFGSLVMVVSGLGALVASAMGNYKAAMGMLALAIGMFCFKGMLNVMSGYDNVKY